MDGPFLKRWRNASRSARSAVLGQATAPICLLILGAGYAWMAVDPVDPDAATPATGRYEIFERIARNPDPLVRLPIDIPFALFFTGAGLLLLRGVAAPFALDRWVPPTEAKRGRNGPDRRT